MSTKQRILKNFSPDKLARFRKDAAEAIFKIKVAESPRHHDFEFQVEDQSAQPSPYPFFVNPNNVLEVLGRKYMPTKRSHNYLPYYWMHFRDIRESVRKVCEIGCKTTTQSRCGKSFSQR